MVTLLDAVKMAYRKHHLDDPSIGWDELSDVLMMALCNEMGDKDFQNWLHQQAAQLERAADGLCPNCGRDYFENETIIDGELRCSCARR